MRVVRLTERFNARRRALGLAGPAAVAVAGTVGALSRELLPGPADREATMPPVAIYWFRRVPTDPARLVTAFESTSAIRRGAIV